MALAREFYIGALLGEWEIPEGVSILGRVPLISQGVERNRSRADLDGRASGIEAGQPKVALLRWATLALPALKFWRASRDV